MLKSMMLLRKYLLFFIRISLLLVMIILGFLTVFPEFLDFKDQLANDPNKEEMSPIVRFIDSIFSKQKSQTVEIAGSIERGFTYTLAVYYEATKQLDQPRCGYAQIFSDDYSPKRKWLYYSPKIQNGKHSITLPLNIYQPKSLCDFKVQQINLSVHKIGSNSTQSDYLFVSDGSIREVLGDDTKVAFLKIAKTQQMMNLQCAPNIYGSVAAEQWTCRQGDFYDGFYPLQYLEEAINGSWTINIHIIDKKSHMKNLLLKQDNLSLYH